MASLSLKHSWTSQSFSYFLYRTWRPVITKETTGSEWKTTSFFQILPAKNLNLNKAISTPHYPLLHDATLVWSLLAHSLTFTIPRKSHETYLSKYFIVFQKLTSLSVLTIAKIFVSGWNAMAVICLENLGRLQWCWKNIQNRCLSVVAKSRYYKERQVDRKKRKAIRWWFVSIRHDSSWAPCS